MGIGFDVVHRSCCTPARAGELRTGHGVVATPAFIPVGSQATVKTVTSCELERIGIPMVLANAYHLYLRVGPQRIASLGGLHRFMGWGRSIVTDSGGYQVFSLARLREVTDAGVGFRSHLDGGLHFITPESAVEMQESMGADIAMALDVVPSPAESFKEVREATERTHLWASRCAEARSRQGQGLFAIVQGGAYEELRRWSAATLTLMGFDGYAIGGLSVGEPKVTMHEVVRSTAPLLPEEKPRYLMGVGSPEDVVRAVGAGMDLFDSVLPTRLARNGALFTWWGRTNIKNASHRDDGGPIDANCGCYTCRNHSAAYVHHLFRSEEMLAYRLGTIHNLTFMQSLMDRLRQSIVADEFSRFESDFLREYRTTDETIRLHQKRRWHESWQGAGAAE